MHKPISSLAQAPMTKYHRLSGLHKRNLFSHNSWSYKSKVKMSAGFFSLEASLLTLQMAAFSLYTYIVFYSTQEPLAVSVHLKLLFL